MRRSFPKNLHLKILNLTLPQNSLSEPVELYTHFVELEETNHLRRHMPMLSQVVTQI